MHEATKKILNYFEYRHLRRELLHHRDEVVILEVSKVFHDVAWDMASTLPECPETTVCLRKLLEGKDAAVRAALDEVALAGD
jgi:hypothetical protein